MQHTFSHLLLSIKKRLPEDNRFLLVGVKGLACHIALSEINLFFRPSIENVYVQWTYTPIGSSPSPIIEKVPYKLHGTFSMVGDKGLEPSTSRSQTARASQLRHTPFIGCLFSELFYHHLGLYLSILCLRTDVCMLKS